MEVVAATTPATESTAAHLLIFVPRADAPLVGGPAKAIDDLLEGALSGLVAEAELTGKRGQVSVLHTLGRGPMKRVLVVGLGEAGGIDLDRVRNAAATAARRARALAGGDLAVAIAGSPLDALAESDVAQAVTEGLILGLYRFDRHLHPKEPPNAISAAQILGADAAAVAEGVRVGTILAQATNFARDMANEPSNLLTPTEMAARAESLARETGLEIQILEEADAAELGMGSFLGVAKGSHQPAKLIILRHRGGGDEPGLALIGKGITFDTGGISLKPPRQHGRHEAGHERRRGRHRRHRRAGAAASPDQHHGPRPRHGEHARRQRHQARRRPAGHERQDDRSAQHRRRRPPDPRRRPRLREPPGTRAPARRRHADRRLRDRARLDDHRPHDQRRRPRHRGDRGRQAGR